MPYNTTDFSIQSNSTFKNIPILQIDTGSGFSKKSDTALLDQISKGKYLITGVSESNPQLSRSGIMTRRLQLFKDYNLEDKIWPGFDLSRFSFIIDKRLKYKRRTDLENQIKASIILEVKRPRTKKIFILGCYRQWQGNSPIFRYNSNSVKD